MDLNKATALKVVQLQVATQEHHPLTSLNMVVCLNNQDPNPPDRWLISSLQASSLVSKAVTVAHLLNLLDSTLTSRWAMELLPVLAATDVVLSRPPMRNGVLRLHKALATDSVATKDKSLVEIYCGNSTVTMYFVNLAWNLGIAGY